jgi:hypothetical protein
VFVYRVLYYPKKIILSLPWIDFPFSRTILLLTIETTTVVKNAAHLIGVCRKVYGPSVTDH